MIDTVVVALIGLLAVAYLLRRLYAAFRPKPGAGACPGCHQCGDAPAPKRRP
jgi:hypothetical protein